MSRTSCTAHTLLEMVIAVAITAIVFSAIAIPALNILSGSKQSACHNNMLLIEGAKTSWCADHLGKFSRIQMGTATADDKPKLQELESYFPNHTMPVCPESDASGHNYDYTNTLTIGTATICPKHGAVTNPY